MAYKIPNVPVKRTEGGVELLEGFLDYFMS